MSRTTCGLTIIAGLLLALSLSSTVSTGQAPSEVVAVHALFSTSDTCMACHNGLVSPSGEDVSIGFNWRASMMANSSRDPYWQAAVRREVTDHPQAQAAIEDECSKCHMPMARFESMTAGGLGRVFEQLPIGSASEREAQLAADGVSCTVCHQITENGLGTPASLVGNFSIDTVRPLEERPVYGPFEIDNGRSTIMRSATGYVQTQSTHIQKSELCATCHTLITHALGPDGETIGELPEQVPYQEWLHSRYREEKSCQDCHMPVVESAMPITSVLGKEREGLSRHDFRGSNFFMIQMLHRYRDELGVQALPQELELSARMSQEHLRNDSARLSVENAQLRDGRIEADLAVVNLGGHKLPTAYPSRRVWLHLTVRDAAGSILFESGALQPDGSISGNDNDVDGARYEPHHSVIQDAGQVQIYESVMVDRTGAPTTGLLSGLRYIKDNRILPDGFDKTTADANVAVHGAAADDADFTGGSDRVRVVIGTDGAQGPFRLDAELWYQPISYRWAQNLKRYDSFETNRFVSYYESMAPSSGIILARSFATIR